MTTTLSGGYTFSDGTTTNTQVSGSDGRVNLPAIDVPATAGAASLAAVSGSSTSSSTIQGVSNALAHGRIQRGTTVTSSGTDSSVPAGSQAIGWGTFLAPNGGLYFANALIAQNVTSAHAQHVVISNIEYDYLSYVGDGVAHDRIQRGTTVISSGTDSVVPTGAQAVGWGTFLSPDGDLYFANALIAQNVTSAYAQHVVISNIEYDYIDYIGNGVSHYRIQRGTTVISSGTNSSVPAGSRAVGWSTQLANNGDLYLANALIAQNVTSAFAQHVVVSDIEYDYLSYVGDGVAHGRIQRGTTVVSSGTDSSVPAGSQAVGWGTFLAPNSDLYFANALIAQNVTSAKTDHVVVSSTEYDYMAYAQATPC